MRFPDRFFAAGTECSTFEKPVPAPCFRKSFTCAEPGEASLVICGLGVYELFVNGARITRGRLSAYISNPDQLLYYDRYDVTDHIRRGKNTVAVMLGGGMLDCPGGLVWDFDRAPYRSAPKFALRFTMGETSFDAGEFVAAPTPTIFNDLRAGEWYDARLYSGDVTAPEYDDGGWRPVIPAQTPKGTKKCNETVPMRVTDVLTARRVRPGRISILPALEEKIPRLAVPEDEAATEGILYDFGVNITGVCRLRIRGARPGQKIILQYGEILGDDPSGDADATVREEDSGLDLRGFHFLPHRYNNRDVYICRGDAEETWEPYFTHHGFRYCLVLGLDGGQAQPDTVTAVVFHTDLARRAEFSCSDPVVNALWDAGIRTDLGNFCHFPTDCPHREKNGWTGDAAVSAEQMLTVLYCEENLREWLCSLRCAMKENGELPGIAPTAGWGYGLGPAWDGAIIEVPYRIWRLRGDTAIIRENADAVVRYLRFLWGMRTERGLIEYGLGDWCPAGGEVDKPKASVAFTSSVTAMQLCRKAAAMLAAVGMAEESAEIAAAADAFRAAIRRELTDPGTGVTRDRCQTAQAMALCYGVFDASEEKNAFRVLLDLIGENGGSFDCGILGMRVLFRVLSRFGQTDLALRMITKPDFPSYGYWLAHGATTFWELFSPIGCEQSSCNHHFFGDILAWFVRDLAGIRLEYDGGAAVLRIGPRFPASLSYAEAAVKLTADADAPSVRCRWRREGDAAVLRVGIPHGVRAFLAVDGAWEGGEDFSSGVPEGEWEIRLLPRPRRL